MTRAWVLAAVLLLVARVAVAAFPPGADATVRVAGSSLAQTNTVTLAPIPGLSIPLQAGKTYVCNGVVRVTTTSATAGTKVGVIAAGGLTATSISRIVQLYAGTALSVNATTTALDATSGGSGVAALITLANVEVVIVVNAAGSIQLAGAQQVLTAAQTSTFLLNSSFWCARTN